MKMIGTVLPTRESLECTERYARKLAADKARVAKLLPGNARVVGGEVRYYESPTRYAIVSNNLEIRRFDVRADGDYPIK